MAKIIPLLLMLLIIPSIIGFASESTFKDLGITDNIYIDSNSATKTISLAHNLPSDNGAYYITLNAYGENTKLRVSINKQLVKVLDLNEFGEEKTYKLRVDNHYLKPTNTITVTEVKMSQDLKIAKAFVLPLGGKKAEETVNILKEFSFLIRKILSKLITIKFLPKILFAKDESFDYAEKIEKLIQKNK